MEETLNLHQLEIFVAIAETGSFSRSAERVSLNQSTISQHIATLEEEVGAPLFDRTGKGVVLTPHGQTFLKHTRRILAERDALLEAMAGLRALDNAQLSIGASNIPANYLVPEILPILAERHPGISLSMQTGDTRETLNRLLAAEVELALIGSRPNQKGVEFLPLYRDRLVLIVGIDHPWRKRGSITLDELFDEPFVVRERGSGTGLALENALRQGGYDPEKLKVAAWLGSNEAVQQAVGTGFGCAFVSELSIAPRRKHHDVFRVEVEGLTVERELWLARLRSRSLSAAGQAFCDLLLDHYAGKTGKGLRTDK